MTSTGSEGAALTPWTMTAQNTNARKHRIACITSPVSVTFAGMARNIRRRRVARDFTDAHPLRHADRALPAAWRRPAARVQPAARARPRARRAPAGLPPPGRAAERRARRAQPRRARQVLQAARVLRSLAQEIEAAQARRVRRGRGVPETVQRARAPQRGARAPTDRALQRAEPARPRSPRHDRARAVPRVLRTRALRARP